MIDRDDEREAYLEQRAAEPKMAWNDGDPKPSWLPDGDRRYRQKMTDWVIFHLDRAPVVDRKPNYELPFNDRPEIDAAVKGNIALLRKKYPHLAKFLHLAKSDDGKRGPSLPWDDHDPAKFAAIEVEEINALWLHHYGRKVRRKNPTAVEIAVSRWGVEVADVERWVKHLKTIGPEK